MDKRVCVGLIIVLLVIFSVVVNAEISMTEDVELYYDFDSVGVITDLSGNGNSGIANGVSWVGNGKYEGSYRFDGVDDSLNVNSVTLEEDFSIAFWVKPGSLKKQGFVSKFDQDQGFGIDMSEIGFLVSEIQRDNEEMSSLLGDSILILNEWSHIVFVYDYVSDGSSIMKLFLNGKLDSIRTDSIGPVLIQEGVLRIGVSNDGEYFRGQIDEFLIFNRALLNFEISKIYEDRVFDVLEKKEILRNDLCPSGYYYSENEGCKAFSSCKSNYVCSSMSSCVNGFRDVICKDRCGLPDVVDRVECNVELCIPDYECTAWSSCVNDLSFRECTDLNDCENDLDKPEEEVVCGELLGLSPDDFCSPNIKCSDWSACEYFDNVEDVFFGSVRLHGIKERKCIDMNGCVLDYIEQSPCKSTFDLELISETLSPEVALSPGFCESEFLTFYSEEMPVSYIDLTAWKENRELDVFFVQSKNRYCGSCYDGTLSEGEEGVDCGGICKSCVIEESRDLRFLIPGLWSAVLFLTLFLGFLNRKYFVRFFLKEKSF